MKNLWTYPDSDHEFIQINWATAIFIKEFQKRFYLLWIQVDAHLSESNIEFGCIDKPVVILINDFEYLSDATDTESTSAHQHLFHLSEEYTAIITQSFRSSYGLSCSWIGCQEDLPNILCASIFLRQIHNMLSYHFVLQLLRSMLDSHLLAADFKFVAELIAVVYLIVEQ